MKKPTAISDIIFQAGEIVVVPFPYAGALAEKRRPALVISNKQFNVRHGLVWVAMITSADNKPWLTDIELPGAGSGLLAASRIRISKMATIDIARVQRKIGKINPKTAMAVAAHFTETLK